MATRSFTIAINRPSLSRWFAKPSNWRVVVWQLMTAPWWVWSDMPRMRLPSRNPHLPAGGLVGDWLVHGLDRLALRIWAQRSLAIIVRGLWLSILVGCLWMLVELTGGPAFDRYIWNVIGLAIMIVSVVVAATSRPSRPQMARMLDRSFGLQERIATALGNIGKNVPADGERASVVYLQMADAANAITMVRTLPFFRIRLPVRELVMAVMLALVFVSLAFARGSAGGGLPETRFGAIPAFVPAAERFVQPANANSGPNAGTIGSINENNETQQLSIDNQRDLQLLADALDDHAITHQAATQIRQGEYGQAAQSLRDVSESTDLLSANSRSELADDLASAAAQMSDGNKTLSGAAGQAADGLREGGPAAQTGMRDLANAVEQSSQQLQTSESADAQSGENDRSGVGAMAGQNQNNAAGNRPNGDNPEGSTGDGSSAGEPGSSDALTGAEAASGIGEDPDSLPGRQGSESAARDSGTTGSNDDDGEDTGQQSGNGESGSNRAEGATSDRSDIDGGASQGTGAGGESENNGSQQSTGNASADRSGQQSSHGTEPSAANVTDAPMSGDNADRSASGDPREIVQLSRAPQGESVQIGGSSAASSLGSGAGVTISGGSTEQGAVGEAGPESNHVPDEYRSIVEDYFSGKERGG